MYEFSMKKAQHKILNLEAISLTPSTFLPPSLYYLSPWLGSFEAKKRFNLSSHILVNRHWAPLTAFTFYYASDIVITLFIIYSELLPLSLSIIYAAKLVIYCRKHVLYHFVAVWCFSTCKNNTHHHGKSLCYRPKIPLRSWWSVFNAFRLGVLF